MNINGPAGADQPTNRFAEMAVELLGSKMAAEFVREVWASAGPEAKAELAAAVLKVMSEKLANTWEFQGAVLVAVARIAAPEIAALAEAQREMIAAKAAESFRAGWEKEVKDVAERALKKAMGEVRDRFWPERR